MTEKKSKLKIGTLNTTVIPPFQVDICGVYGAKKTKDKGSPDKPLWTGWINHYYTSAELADPLPPSGEVHKWGKIEIVRAGTTAELEKENAELKERVKELEVWYDNRR